ncbi:hypothetical protein [Bradyrhizobium sp. 153]|uniref:hypothetical protein n=1 Tax=Bradyrhizobium sp. 153 TaxID=2782627 RepID=UPI001FFBB353|nr:hypothetical protein [Bradyrhizobium sp. 153]MCK1668654.1 hypothetical protein [Bradyrhizobium sp. 153]
MTEVGHIPSAVCAKFCELALKVKRRGFEHYSADAILHRIRWHFQIEREDREFKCNNNWTSTLARWAMETHPELNGFFETRNRKECVS